MWKALYNNWVECDQPKPRTGVLVRNATYVGEADRLFCCVQDGEKQILVFASQKKIFAYNVKTEKVEWKLPKMENMLDATGMTIDGRGHLFVCDL